MNNSRFRSRLASSRFVSRSSGGGDSITRIIDISGLQAWYKTDTTEFLDIPSGTGIARFLDASGKGNHTSFQSTSTKRPTRATNQLNGRQLATFDNGDTLVITNAASLFSAFNGPLTIFCVAKTVDVGNNDVVLNAYEGGSLRASLRFTSTNSDIYFQSNDTTTGGVTNTSGTDGIYQILKGRRNGTTQALAINGGTEASNSSGASESGIDSIYIGSNADTDSYLNGGIAEILIYNRALSTAETLQVELYLADKWAIYHPQASWINSYSSFWQMLIHAWKINRDDVGTNTTGNPFAAIYDPSVAALGSTTSLTDVGRGVNTATEATNPPVNTATAIGSARGLLYNGTTTTLSAGSDTSVDNIFAAGGCFIGVIKPTTVGENNDGRVFDKAASVMALNNTSGSTCKLEFFSIFSSVAGDWSTTNRDITLGSANIVAVTYSTASTTNDPSIYVNSLTAKAITEAGTPSGTPNSDAASNLILGNNAAATRTADGYLGKMIFLKSVPTTAQLTSVFNFLATEYGVTLT